MNRPSNAAPTVSSTGPLTEPRSVTVAAGSTVSPSSAVPITGRGTARTTTPPSSRVTVTPRPAAASRAAGSTSHPATGRPPAARAAASEPPSCPSPTTATGGAGIVGTGKAGAASSGTAPSDMIRGYDLRADPRADLRADPRAPASLRVMTPRSFLLTQELADYVRASSERPDEVAADLLAETAALAERGKVPATFQIAPEQGAFMQLLTRALGARRAVEVGTFTGFSALCIARGLPGAASPLCLDITEEWTAIARRYWERAGLEDRIELRLGPALDSLRALPAEPTLDLAFVDADKTGYAGYVEELHPRLTDDAVVLLDNTLRGGRVLDPQSDDDRAIAELNAALAADPRWETVLLPLADGLTFLRKR